MKKVSLNKKLVPRISEENNSALKFFDTLKNKQVY